MSHESERYRRGWERLAEVNAEAGDRLIASLQGVAPDLGRYAIEFVFGDIYSRPGLDLRQRQLLTITALTAIGDAEPQLEVHVNAGLNVGLSPSELVEAMLHCIPYAGFPRVLAAISVARRTFEQRGVAPLLDGE